jgi:hypothetical protein
VPAGKMVRQIGGGEPQGIGLELHPRQISIRRAASLGPFPSSSCLRKT